MLLKYCLPLATLIVHSLCQSSTDASGPARSTDGPRPTDPPDPTGGVTPSQSSEFKAAFGSYLSSLTRQSAFSSLYFNFVLNVPQDVRGSLTRNPSALVPVTGSFDLRSYATDPPLIFSTATWEDDLPGTVKDEYKSIQTSIALEAASIGQSVIGISTSIPTPRATPADEEGGAPARLAAGPAGLGVAMGAAGLAAGAAAIVL